jgi:mycoredoxin
MLNVYAAEWCPHCEKTIEWLAENNIEFHYFEIEEQEPELVEKIVRVNGGDDWVVPTLEFNGTWRPGKAFSEEALKRDLQDMGVI